MDEHISFKSSTMCDSCNLRSASVSSFPIFSFCHTHWLSEEGGSVHINLSSGSTSQTGSNVLTLCTCFFLKSIPFENVIYHI